MIEIVPERPGDLAWYARIPIAYDVTEVLDIEERADGIAWTPRRLSVPYVKDYDAIADNGPAAWADHFDLAGWIFLAAREAGALVGAAALAMDTRNVEMLDGRDDLAVLWDIRVAPEHRGRGIGTALFEAAESNARAGGRNALKIETQDINAGACRFYARMGCTLGAIHRDAYPELPHETQMLWYKWLRR